MTLAPLLNASTAIQIHAAAALAAFLIGAVQLIGVKGTGRHRALGYVWVSLMLVVALSAFWIHEINQLGGYSAIHLLSVLTLITAPLAVLAAPHGPDCPAPNRHDILVLRRFGYCRHSGHAARPHHGPGHFRWLSLRLRASRRALPRL